MVIHPPHPFSLITTPNLPVPPLESFTPCHESEPRCSIDLGQCTIGNGLKEMLLSPHLSFSHRALVLSWLSHPDPNPSCFSPKRVLRHFIFRLQSRCSAQLGTSPWPSSIKSDTKVKETHSSLKKLPDPNFLMKTEYKEPVLSL